VGESLNFNLIFRAGTSPAIAYVENGYPVSTTLQEAVAAEVFEAGGSARLRSPAAASRGIAPRTLKGRP
jgi:hypothetical protein